MLLGAYNQRYAQFIDTLNQLEDLESDHVDRENKLLAYMQHLKDHPQDLKVYMDPGYIKYYVEYFLHPCIRSTRLE